MNTYQYQVLRFLPDRVSGEFVNLGVVVYDQKRKQLIGKFYQKITRVSSFFPTINSRYLASTLKFLQKEFEIICSKFNSEISFESIESIDEITRQVLPKDDSALFFTDSKKLLELTIDMAVEDLYEKFVVNYIHEDEREYVTDKEVWQKLYKSYFDSLRITEHLKSHKIKTELDTWEFEKAWKNGVWNCFETVSFDLVKEESIKDKTYKWWGKVDELRSTNEPIHVYLLSKLPSQHPELKKFIKKKLGNIKHGKNITVELVSEMDAEKFAKRIKKEIEQHQP
jgi:hypothetical protein